MFGVQMGARNKAVESFKQLNGIQLRAEEAKGNDAFVSQGYESRTFTVDDSISQNDSIMLLRVVIRDQENKMVSFSDYYLTNGE